MHRRRFLCTTTALLTSSLAGGAHPIASLTMIPVDDASLAERASGDPGSRVRSLVADAVENGSATTTAAHPPFAPDRPVVYDGRYYAVSRSVTDERGAFAVDIEIDYDPESPDGKRVRFEELPDLDRTALSSLLPPADRSPRRRSGRGCRLDVHRGGTRPFRVRPRTAIRRGDVRGVVLPFSVTSRPTTVREYRYVATEVAADATAFAARVRAEHRYALGTLREGTRRRSQSHRRGLSRRQ